MSNTIKLLDNSSIKGRETDFVILTVDLEKIIESWQISLFSFEWLEKDGRIKNPKYLSANIAKLYTEVENAYKFGRGLERPVLGIGLMENVEIGSKKEVLLTLHYLGIKSLEVHVPKSCLIEFEKYKC